MGTEFGAFYTLGGGEKWFKIGGLPTISVRDVDIQRRENDLVFATFGRGFYIVDDYSPLQIVTVDDLGEDAHVFPIKDALFYIPSRKGRGSQGASYWTASNPPFGLFGGTPGIGGGNYRENLESGHRDYCSSKGYMLIEPGQAWVGVSSGGGGFGDPLDRPAERVCEHVRAARYWCNRASCPRSDICMRQGPMYVLACAARLRCVCGL